MMLEYVEYSDDQITLRLPKQLRQKRGVHFFQGKLIRGTPESEVLLGFDINLDRQEFESRSEQLLKHPIGGSWMGTEFRLERRGTCPFGERGVEKVSSTYNTITKHTSWGWIVLSQFSGRYVQLELSGGFEDLSQFEAMGREVIGSLRVKSGGFTHNSSEENESSGSYRINNTKRVGMRAREKMRLAKALKRLPSKLRYLENPILAIANEDQEMLSTGDVDTTVLAEMIKRQAALLPGGFAVVQSEELGKWLASVANREDTWAGPAWFALGFLMSYDTFSEESQRRP